MNNGGKSGVQRRSSLTFVNNLQETTHLENFNNRQTFQDKVNVFCTGKQIIKEEK